MCLFTTPQELARTVTRLTISKNSLKSFLNQKATILCGDINCPDVNWKTLASTNEEENKVLELFEESLYRQIINFPTCGQNTLDVSSYKNCNLVAHLDEKFSSIYDCSDHKSIQLTLECPRQDAKETLGNFRNFGNADYESINNILSTEPFKPVCFTNINNMCEEFYQYMDQILEVHVPKRTRHRQSLPPSISSFTF